MLDLFVSLDFEHCFSRELAMRRALIIASCGLIVALIISATTRDVEGGEKNNVEHFFDKKCIEPAVVKQANPSCATLDDTRADMFLREVKRKVRRAYA
jgi:hypothetical protein